MIVAAMALSLGVGAVCGLVNGLTTTLGRIEPFIVTLGTMGIFRSLLTWLAQGGSITIRNSDVRAAYRPVYFGDLFGVPYPVLVILGVALDRRLRALSHRLRPASARGRLQRGRGALFRRQRRSGPHPRLCLAGALRRHRGRSSTSRA